MNHNVVLRLLSREARDLQENIALAKRMKARYWAKAVPGTVEGQRYFNLYTCDRALLLTCKKQLKQVNSCIKAIKQGSRSPK